MLTNNLSLRNKSLRARIKVYNFSEGAQGLYHHMLWLRPMETENAEYRKVFCLSEKKSKGEEQFYNDDFRKVIIYNSIPDALRDLHVYKCKRPHNRPYDACLWKPAKRNKVHTSKQLWFVASTEIFNGNQALDNSCMQITHAE